MDEATKKTMSLIDGHKTELLNRSSAIDESIAKIEEEKTAAINKLLEEKSEIDRFLAGGEAPKTPAAAPNRKARRAKASKARKAAAATTPRAKPGPKPSPDSRSTKVLRFLLKNPGAGAREIAAALHDEVTKVSQVLHGHKKAGKVTAKGDRNHRTYFATKEAAA